MDFPLPFAVFLDVPTDPGQLRNGFPGSLATLLHRFGVCRVRPDVAAKGIQLHTTMFTGIDPAAKALVDQACRAASQAAHLCKINARVRPMPKHGFSDLWIQAGEECAVVGVERMAHQMEGSAAGRYR